MIRSELLKKWYWEVLALRNTQPCYIAGTFTIIANIKREGLWEVNVGGTSTLLNEEDMCHIRDFILTYYPLEETKMDKGVPINAN